MQKQIVCQILPTTKQKIRFCYFKKTALRSFRQGTTIRKCKAKVIHSNLGIFKHIQGYSEPRVTLAHSKPWYIRNLGLFRTRGIIRSPESLHTQNQRHFQTPGIFKTLAYSGTDDPYSELCQTFLMESFSKIRNKYCCFRNINFSRSPLYEINIMKFFY